MVCPEVGRVETFMQSSQALEQWMEDADTDPDLVECIMDYVQGRGTVTMALAVQNAPARFQALGRLQDKIGRHWFLEGWSPAKLWLYSNISAQLMVLGRAWTNGHLA